MNRNYQDSLIDHSPPISGTSTPLSQSASSSGTYGIGSAVASLWRRISSADSSGFSQSSSQQHVPSQLSTSMPVFPTGRGGDGINGAFTPPRRQGSPRMLPSLEPLVLAGHKADTPADERLLSRSIAEEIRTFLPERLKIGDEWNLVYSLYQNGSSLGTLYQRCEDYRGRRCGFVLVVRDGKEGTFGAYLTEAPHPASSYFGTGECFLWRASTHIPLPPPPSEDTTNLNYRSTTIASPTSAQFPQGDSSSSTLAPGSVDPTTNRLAGGENGNAKPQPQESIRFQNFAYSGLNDYCIFCESKFLSVGGGSGTYGLWLDDELSMGHSSPCDTFMNTALSNEGEKFDVLGVELWVVGAS